MFLETQRLILRKIQESDFADFCVFAADPEACRMMGRDLITDAATARPTFDWLKDREERGYVLIYKDTGHAIGNLTVYNTIPEYLRYLDALHGKQGRSLSFSISKDYRRMGLMEEAVRHVIRHLFMVENADCILYGYFGFNIPSRELQKKLGFLPLWSEQIDMDGENVICHESILWKSQWIHQQNP